MFEESAIPQVPGAVCGEVDLAVAHLLVPQLLEMAVSTPDSNCRRVFEILGLCELFGIETPSSNGHSYKVGFD